MRTRPFLNPVLIQTGGVTHSVALTTMSPYFGGNFSARLGKLPPLTIDQADYWNHAATYFASGSENKGPPPLGVSRTTVVFDSKLADYEVNFRYVSAEKDVVAAIWQVSRFPFPNDPRHWERQYIPGFVGAGLIRQVHVDGDGYRYFTVNFARIASQGPGAPPYFEGGVSGAGQAGTVNPFLAGRAAPRAPSTMPSRPMPGVFGTAPAQGRHIVVSPGIRAARPAMLASLALPADSQEDQTFYLRVVPIHANNQAGVPAIPVTVTVQRPRPCPTQTRTMTVRPPSARIVWYMQPNFYNSQSSTGHWYVVNGAQAFLPNGLHMLDPPPKPEDKSWYESVISDFNSIVDFFSSVMSDFAVMWNGLEDTYVNLAATTLSYSVTGGLYRCDKDPHCTLVIKSAGQAAMAAYGIPPTLPTGPELLDASSDYLIRVGADEIGASAALDAYQQLPDEVKPQMQSGARDVATALVQQQSSAVRDKMANEACVNIPNMFQAGAAMKLCPARIQDPIFTAVHPATTMLYFENANSEPTDPMIARVTDSRGLFRTGSVRVPSLAPGEHVSVPVILEEDTDQFLDINHGPCPTRDAVTVSGEASCQQQRWLDKFYQLGTAYQTPKAPDTFRVTFRTATTILNGNGELGDLDANSSGRQLANVFVVEPGAMCQISGSLNYPDGWRISTDPRTVMADAWDNLFSQGPNDPGNPSNGMLRAR
jgi:hypothetical protein